jgi:SAM-dependent methyltransferase
MPTKNPIMARSPNSYSQSWFEIFHVPIAEERTKKEVDFISAVAPLPDFPRVLDVCCGTGRHARALAARGYSVTGVERDRAAVSKARESGGGPHYIETDVRDYRPATSAHDLAMVMSQGFGYFYRAVNHDLLQRLANAIRGGGRIILDLWNPEFFVANQGERELKTPGGVVHENKHIEGDRLFVRLTYPDGANEEFEWQLFAPAEMESLAESMGLDLLTSCTEFNAATNPAPDCPRTQFVLHRRALNPT